MDADLINRLERWISKKPEDLPRATAAIARAWPNLVMQDIQDAIFEMKLAHMEHITEVTATNEVREILIEICNYPAALIALPRPLLDRLEAEAAIAKENKE